MMLYFTITLHIFWESPAVSETITYTQRAIWRNIKNVDKKIFLAVRIHPQVDAIRVGTGLHAERQGGRPRWEHSG